MEAGFTLGIGSMLTRRLWFVSGLHFAWNVLQGGVFGVAVSGIKVDGLLRGELSGDPLVSSGAFGPEASVIAAVLCPLVTASLDRAAYPTKVKVTKAEMQRLDLERHEVCPDWNYTIGPRRTVLRN